MTPPRPNRCPTASASLLEQALGVDGRRRRRARAPIRCGFGRRRCRTADRDGLTAIVGADYCRVDDRGRLLRAGGKSTLDLLRRTGLRCPGRARRGAAARRRGRDRRDPALLRRPQHRRRPVRRRHQRGRRPRPDPRRLQRRRLAGPAPPRRTALRSTRSPARPNSAPGSPGPDAERLLGERGFSLGHFPQSFQFATIGGFAATRSSGQDSAGYGRFNDMVRGLRAVTPAGVLDLGRAPESAAGPDLRQLLIGSEGVFGDHHPGAGAGAPGPGGHPLRGVVVPRLRHRRRRAARRRPDRHRADRDPAVRRGRDRRQPGDHRATSASSRSPAAAWRSRCSRAPRRTSRAGTPRRARCWRPAAARRWARRPRTRLGARPLQRAVSARLAAVRRRAVRDAGDGDQLVQPARAQGRGHRGADRRRWPNRAHRRWCCATFRTCIPPGHRCTSPSSPAQRGNPIEQWRTAKTAASDAMVARRRHHHPPPRRRRRSPAVDARRGRRPRRRRCCGPSRRRSTRPESSTRAS